METMSDKDNFVTIKWPVLWRGRKRQRSPENLSMPTYKNFLEWIEVDVPVIDTSNLDVAIDYSKREEFEKITDKELGRMKILHRDGKLFSNFFAYKHRLSEKIICGSGPADITDIVSRVHNSVPDDLYFDKENFSESLQDLMDNCTRYIAGLTEISEFNGQTDDFFEHNRNFIIENTSKGILENVFFGNDGRLYVSTKEPYWEFRAEIAIEENLDYDQESVCVVPTIRPYYFNFPWSGWYYNGVNRKSDDRIWSFHQHPALSILRNPCLKELDIQDILDSTVHANRLTKGLERGTDIEIRNQSIDPILRNFCWEVRDGREYMARNYAFPNNMTAFLPVVPDVKISDLEPANDSVADEEKADRDIIRAFCEALMSDVSSWSVYKLFDLSSYEIVDEFLSHKGSFFNWDGSSWSKITLPSKTMIRPLDFMLAMTSLYRETSQRTPMDPEFEDFLLAMQRQGQRSMLLLGDTNFIREAAFEAFFANRNAPDIIRSRNSRQTAP